MGNWVLLRSNLAVARLDLVGDKEQCNNEAMDCERDYWLAFSGFLMIGPRRFKVLLKYFDSAKKAWNAKDKIWWKLGLGEKLTEKFLEYRQNFDFREYSNVLIKQSIRTICLSEKNYPTLLKQSEVCPFVLYIKGKILPQDAKAVAVVGTRKITLYGREVTEKFTTQLVACGFTIVSGLARGVDGAAHRAALSAGGRTFAVLGSGLDRIYPVQHIGLASQVVENGALISEYPPGTVALPQNFPARNRIIAGLSLGVLVAEGAAKSGTKITARAAIEQGREVFAVPGPITSPMSAAPADLIKVGAKLVTSIGDILEELPVAMDNRPRNALRNPIPERDKNEFSTEEEQAVWEALLAGAKQINDIVKATELSAPVVSSTLTLLEVSGKVKSIGNGNYMIV